MLSAILRSQFFLLALQFLTQIATITMIHMVDYATNHKLKADKTSNFKKVSYIHLILQE